MSDSKRTAGFAIAVVILVLAVVMVGVLATVSVTALGTRSAAANERAAFQALLAAESGLNTFEARYASLEEPYNGELNVNTLNQWLAENDLDSLGLPRGRAELEVVSVDEDSSSITLRSRGFADGQGRREVLYDFVLERLGNARGINLPAAFTSRAGVRVGNNIEIVGQAIGPEAGLIQNYSQYAGTTDLNVLANSASPLSLPLPTGDGARFVVGDYVQLGGNTFRVTSATKNAFTVVPVPPPTMNVTIEPETPIDLVRSGVRNGSIGVSGGLSWVEVSRVYSYYEGVNVEIGGHLGKVRAVDEEQRRVQVEWASSVGSSLNVAEGTPVKPRTYGIYTAGDVEYATGNVGPDDVDPITAPDTSLPDYDADDEGSLFYSTFGIGVDEFVEMVPEERRYTGSSINVNLDNEIAYVETSQNLQNWLCGSGVVVVRNTGSGSLNFNANTQCDGPFNGVLYVLGDARIQGNVQYQGAFVVDGTAEFEKVNISGAGGGARIAYDAGVLDRMARLITSERVLEPRAGSWRQH